MSRKGVVEFLRGTSIEARFMFYFGSVVLLLMATVILVAGHRQWRSAMSQLEMRGATVANSLAGLASGSLLNYDYGSLQQFADEVRKETKAAYVIILDKEERVAGYSGRAELQGTMLGDEVSRAVAEAQGNLVLRHSGLDDEKPLMKDGNLLEVAVPARVKGSELRWGTVRVGLSLTEMKTELTRTQRDLTLLGLAAVIVVLFSAHYFTSRITGPLRQLAEAARVVASGRLDHQVNEDLVGVLGETARSFNKMTADLQRSRDAVRYQNQHLENMVQERTAALRDKARELEKANEELKVVDRLKSDFLSNVSHELRTPLTSIRSFTEILMDDSMPLDPAEQREFLGIVASQADRLARLISDLLDLSKIEAGEFHCSLESMSLSDQVVQPCLETLRTLASESDVQLVSDLQGQIPAVLGDSDRLNQVLTNLVDNALKFTPAGGQITVRSWVSEHRCPPETFHGEFAGMESDTPEFGHYAVVEVRDTGVGIDEKDRRLIFEKFGQVGNVLTSKPQGTGLGLAISGNIMVQHGGAIWVDSTPGEGSRFYFSVPVSIDMAKPKRKGSDSGPARPAGAAGLDLEHLIAAVDECSRGKRVLVVDDEDQIVQRITQSLEPLGYRAVGCKSGQQAVAQAKDLRPDCMIVDILMPDLNGYDVLRLVKADPVTADTPVVVLGPASEARKALELGAARHVPKDSDSAGDQSSSLQPAAI